MPHNLQKRTKSLIRVVLYVNIIPVIKEMSQEDILPESEQDFDITCSENAQNDVFERLRVSLDVVLCGINWLGNIAEEQNKSKTRYKLHLHFFKYCCLVTELRKCLK